jgi:hypothetical protein
MLWHGKDGNGGAVESGVSLQCKGMMSFREETIITRDERRVCSEYAEAKAAYCGA